MIALAATGLLVAFAAFAGLSTWAVEEGVKRTLDERQILAQALADRVAYLLQDNLDKLQEALFSAHFGPGRSDVEVARQVLHEVYLGSIYGAGVYLLDTKGELLLAEPQTQTGNTAARTPYVRRTVESGRPVVSDVYRLTPSAKPIISAFMPVRNNFGESWLCLSATQMQMTAVWTPSSNRSLLEAAGMPRLLTRPGTCSRVRQRASLLEDVPWNGWLPSRALAAPAAALATNAISQGVAWSGVTSSLATPP